MQSTEPDEPATALDYRFGRSPFWLRLRPETYSAVSQTALRATLSYRAARSRKLESDLPLIEITPRRPLFTAVIAGESFPLLVSSGEESGRGIVALSGTRKIFLKSAHALSWTAKLRSTTGRAGVVVKVDFKASFDPPLPARVSGDLRVELFSPMHCPEPWWFPYAPDSHRGAATLWGKLGGVSVSLALPGADCLSNGVATHSDSATSLVQTAPGVLRRSKGAYAFSMRFDTTRTRSHAQFMHMQHTVQSLPPSLPEHDAGRCEELGAGLRGRALRALQRLTDKGGYDVVGIERVYVKGDRRAPAQSEGPEFVAGFPHFPLDAARAMLDWHMLVGGEDCARLALLIARGIATDFSVTCGETFTGLNKGAFWDRRTGPAGAKNGTFTDFIGDDFHSIASTGRIARGLFAVHARTGDTTSLHAALNAAQWLILKQNVHGYYDGDRVCSATGAVIGGEETLSGIEVVPPLLMAYRATGNEVYVKTAMRVLRHVTTVLMPGLVACPIYRTRFATGADTPASVAALIRTLALAHSESATRRTREEIEMAGMWLRAWDMGRLQDDPTLDTDGHHDGLYEIARASLQMLGITGQAAWLDLALRIAGALPDSADEGWQALPLFLETLLSLVALTPRASVDLNAYTARVGWSDFAADSSTAGYIAVEPWGDGAQASVDHLPLVCRADDRVLVPVLSDRAVGQVRIRQNGKLPNLRDLVTGEIVCQPAPLHKLPFASPMRWGCFTIDP